MRQALPVMYKHFRRIRIVDAATLRRYAGAKITLPSTVGQTLPAGSRNRPLKPRLTPAQRAAGRAAAMRPGTGPPV